MLHVNKAILIGNAGKDAVLSKTAHGDDVARFSLATTERWTDGDGRKQERTQWHNVVAFKSHALAAGRFVRKGGRVMVEGRIEQRDWTDREGETQRIVEIRVAGGGMVNVLDRGPADGRETEPDGTAENEASAAEETEAAEA